LANSIFISYSRQDEKQALHLLNILRREGYTVWIDQESIAGASIWSDEIVQNIKHCGILIALISSHSAESHNVSKEIALAAENRKIILPIEIGHVELPGQLEYALAGIQRTSYSDEQAILHAVKNQFAKLSGESVVPTPKGIHKKLFARKRLVIGSIVGSALVIGGFFFLSASKPQKAIAESVVVLPFSTLNLEKDSTRNLDIFSETILTRLAKLEGLSLVSVDVSSQYKNSELNPMAIGKELGVRFVVEGTVRKMHDVNFVAVRVFDTKRGGQIWESSVRCNAKELMNIRQRVCDNVFGTLNGLVSEEKYIKTLEEKVKANPNDASAYGNLAERLISSDKSRAISLFEQAIKLDPDNASYVIRAGIVATRQSDLHNAGDYGRKAVDLCEKLLKKYPDSLGLATNYALALDMANQPEKALRVFDSLLILRPTDMRLLYNAACCYAKQSNSDKALDLLERVFPIAPGKRAEVVSDPDFDNIRATPRYQKVIVEPLNKQN
jgi:TolB-like protein/Flp pilus assembly protein TadD